MSANSEKTEETKSDAKLSNKMDSIELKLEEMHAQDSVQSPSTPLPGGIGVFADFVIGACSALADGVSKASVEHFEKKYIGITACTATEGPGVQGETIGTSDEEIRGVFGTPDGADRQPVHSDAGSPHRSQAPQNLQKNACTNEMHAIAKEGNWTTLRSRLTTASDHSHTVNLTGQVDQKGRTPLMLACLHGPKFPADVARLLLVANNKSASIYMLQKNGGRHYCLHQATIAGCNIEVLDILYGAYPRAATTPDGNGNMPLHLAVNNGRYRSISGQLGVRDEDGASTMLSSPGSVISVPTSVITDGVSSDRSQDKSSARSDDELSLTTTTLTGGAGGYEEDLLNVCDFLITSNQSVLLHRNKRGETPLLLAIYRRSPSDVLSLLLVRGGTASLKIADDSGSYPIHFCDRSNSIGVIRDMADLYPAAIMQTNKQGNTPLYSAISYDCSIAILRILLETCPKPRETVNSKNKMDINIIQFGWDDLTTQKMVAAEDQDEEDARLQSCAELIKSAISSRDIQGTYLGNWWNKATLLLQAAYHNTIKSNKDGFLSGRVWRPVHAAAGTSCPPAAVKFLLQIYSEEVGFTDENLNTPLHIAASRPEIISFETIKMILTAYPLSMSMQNNDGYTPLHVACLYKAPLEILQLLIEVCPDSTCIQNRFGQTPLFIAIGMGSPVDILRALLLKRPESVHIRDIEGTSTISLAWQLLLSGKHVDERNLKVKEEVKRSNVNISSLAVVSRSSSLKGDVRTWMSKIDTLLRASFHNTVEEPLPKGRQWRAVHAACAGGTVPPDVLAFALQILRSEAVVVNERGNLPLHIAAFAPPHTADCSPQLGTGRSIDMLLKISAKAAFYTDKKGRLPLHLALASGKTWDNGVKRLIDVFPESERMRDPVTLLYPFMLAACENDYRCKEDNSGYQESLEGKPKTRKADAELASINTIFMLLRSAPKFITKKENDAEIFFLWRSRKELLVEKEQLKKEILKSETELQKRMTVIELQDIEDKKRKELARIQEEERRARVNHLEVNSQSHVKSLSIMGNALMTLKHTGL